MQMTFREYSFGQLGFKRTRGQKDLFMVITVTRTEEDQCWEKASKERLNPIDVVGDGKLRGVAMKVEGSQLGGSRVGKVEAEIWSWRILLVLPVKNDYIL